MKGQGQKFITLRGPHKGEVVKIWKSTKQKVLFFRLQEGRRSRTNPITTPAEAFYALHSPLDS